MTEFPALISVNEAAKLTSLSRTSIFKLRSQGKFPKAVPLGEKRVAFVRAEVAAWVEERIADAQGEAGAKA
jgi:prophage regulatory protein